MLAIIPLQVNIRTAQTPVVLVMSLANECDPCPLWDFVINVCAHDLHAEIIITSLDLFTQLVIVTGKNAQLDYLFCTKMEKNAETLWWSFFIRCIFKYSEVRSGLTLHEKGINSRMVGIPGGPGVTHKHASDELTRARSNNEVNRAEDIFSLHFHCWNG